MRDKHLKVEVARVHHEAMDASMGPTKVWSQLNREGTKVARYTVERLMPIHEAQILTYLKLSGLRTGLLLNFNSAVLKDGMRRIML